MHKEADTPQAPRRGLMFGLEAVVGEYEAVLEAIRNLQQPAVVAYAHFDVLLRCLDDPRLRALLSRCSLTYIDGIGARMAFRVLHGRPVARINATDMNHRLLRELALGRRRIAMIGAWPDSVNPLRHAMHTLGIDNDHLLIRHGFSEVDDVDTVEILQRFKADALFIGLGTPRQFDWLAAHQGLQLAPLTVLTGGFFEILAGTKRRAPEWMQYAGLEWLHRLLLEPGRLWRRYLLGIPRFIAALAKEKFRTIRTRKS